MVSSDPGVSLLKSEQNKTANHTFALLSLVLASQKVLEEVTKELQRAFYEYVSSISCPWPI